LGAGQGAAHEAESHAALAGEIVTVTGLVRRLDVAIAAVHPAAGLVVVLVLVAGLGVADLVVGLLGPGGLAPGPGAGGLPGRPAPASRERVEHHQYRATRHRVHWLDRIILCGAQSTQPKKGNIGSPTNPGPGESPCSRRASTHAGGQSTSISVT